MSFVPDSDLRPYVLLIFGLFSLFMAVVGTCIGETLARFSGMVYRAEAPKQFWLLIAAYYLGAAFFIGFFFYKVYGL